MTTFNKKLLELDIDKLFEEHTVNEIVEVEKLLDADIEKKRVELRGMVGDRYKDVLTASDAIKSMKNISEGIVDNIQRITDRCEALVASTLIPCAKNALSVDPALIEERTIIMQIRLAMAVNSQVWMALEAEDFLKAAQVYLLAQHIHTGLQLLSQDVLEKLPILKRMKCSTDTLRNRILKRAKEKLKTVHLSVEEASSNLNTLMLLEQYGDDVELLDAFVDLRKTALDIVINKSYSNVRLQVIAMIRCLVATIHLLHSCFINFKDNKCGLIWQLFEGIVGDGAPTTLSKVTLPLTPLVTYIPDIIKQFKPTRAFARNPTVLATKMEAVIEHWLNVTSESIRSGLQGSLELIPNIKGLHIIREESLKIELPENWENICGETHLPANFHVWFHFFQALVTSRAKALISKKVSKISVELQSSIREVLGDTSKTLPSESDLRWYTWNEEEDDVSCTENKHLGLSMKTRGYSSNIVKLCRQMDEKYLELLEDLSLYLYGAEYSPNDDFKFLIKSAMLGRKFVDRNELEEFLRSECTNYLFKLTSYLQDCLQSDQDCVVKSLICARFLQALCEFCPSLIKCCSSDDRSSDWETICSHLNKYTIQFYHNWLSSCVKQSETAVKNLKDIGTLNMLRMLPKWDHVEIQEQADEKIFKSQIKIPSHPSLCLQKMLANISDQLSIVVPHTLPKQIHLHFIEANVQAILQQYENLSDCDLNQIQALQFLFDVKFVTTLCVPRENLQLVSKSQGICDKLRAKIDPFDLDVFYSYLQSNVKTCVLQSQVILGCLLPSIGHLASLGMFEKSKDLGRDPSVLAVSIPTTTSWFPLLPVTTPVQKISTQAPTTPKSEFKAKNNFKPAESVKKPSGSVSSVRSGAAAFFGGLTNDWFL